MGICGRLAQIMFCKNTRYGFVSFAYKYTLIFIMCFSIVTADSKADSKTNIESKQTTQENEELLNKTKEYIKPLFDVNDLVEDAKCDETWQKKVCDGSIMCYATKCFYPEANISMMHRIFLENLIIYLKNNHEKMEKERIEHLSNISNLGLPKDNKLHNYTFINQYGDKCIYTLWQKDDKTLFFDLSGCLKNKNQKMTRTLIQNDLGVIELYEHIGY